MEKIKEDLKENLKKDLIKYRHQKDKTGIQETRKQMSFSSRFLDNHYNPRLHHQPFIAGKIKSVEKIEKIEKKEKLISEEFYKLQDDEIMITIEHCSNCSDHQTHTNHINNIYLNYSRGIMKSILLRFSFLRVLLKPCDESDKIGALEIKLIKNNMQQIIHSKLSDKSWPRISNILDKINMYLPFFCLNVKLINSEANHLNIKKIEVNKSIAKTKTNDEILENRVKEDDMKNIEVKIYQIKHPSIEEISNYLSNEISIIYDPKKRLEYTKVKREQEYYEKNVRYYHNNSLKFASEESLIPSRPLSVISGISFYEKEKYNNKPLSSIKEISENIFENQYEENYNNFDLKRDGLKSARHTRPLTSIRSGSKPRPQTGTSSNFLPKIQQKKPTSAISTVTMTSNNTNYSKLSTITNFNNKINLTSYVPQYNFTDHEIIENKDIINLIKGKLIIKDYTNSEGSIQSYNLPLDHYLIEVVDSKNFHGTAMVIKFTSIQNKISRDITLQKQSNSFVELFTFTVLDEQEQDLEIISGCKVFIKSLFDYTYDEENRIELKEKLKGRFECVVEPGKYVITCFSSDYEVFRKEIVFYKGENIVNIELKPEKKVEIEVIVVDYFTGEKIKEVSYEERKIFTIDEKYIKNKKIAKDGVALIDTLKLGEGINLIFSKKGYYQASKNIFRKEFQTNNKHNIQNKDLSTIKNDANDISNIHHFNITTKIFLISKEELKKREIGFIFIFYSNINLFNRKETKEELIKVCDFEFEFYNEALPFITKTQHSKDEEIISIEITLKEKEYNISQLHKTKHINDKQTHQVNFKDLNLISRLNLKIKDSELSSNYIKLGKNNYNSLLLNCFEVNVYTSVHNYFVSPPLFSSQHEYSYWDVGYLDLKNQLFFELNILNNLPSMRTSFFQEWIDFLGFLFTLKKRNNLFDIFGGSFNQSNNKTMHDVAFFRTLKQVFDDSLTSEFMIFSADLFKNSDKLVSFPLLLEKLESNLKNFK